jgi:hypothetical protein
MPVATNPNFEYWVSCSDTTPCPDLIEDKIRSFATLQDGWNYGEGRAPSQAVIEQAILIHREGKKLGLDAEVFPFGDGDIEISMYMRDHFMDVFVYNDGRMDFSYEVGIGKQYETIESKESISMPEVKERLCQLPRRCGALESSEIITIKSKNDFPLTVLRTAKEGFRFLIENVSQSVTLPLFADTSGIFIVLSSLDSIP